jgi:hypothetical protein
MVTAGDTVVIVLMLSTEYPSSLSLLACIVLAIWNVPVGLKFFAFFLSGTADGIAAIIYSAQQSQQSR